MEIAEDHLTEAFYVRLFQNEEDENKDLGKLKNSLRSQRKQFRIIVFRFSRSKLKTNLKSKKFEIHNNSNLFFI